jgi:HD-GYP domain-containing protein (c-di-GMP phosphodiesterase class II)
MLRPGEETLLIIAPEETRPGMKLAAPVPHPEHPDQHLLKSGYVLEASVIGRLREMRVDHVYVDYPALDDLDRHLAPLLSSARQKIYYQIRDSVTTMQRATRAAVPYSQYCALTRELITTLMDQGPHPIFLDQMSRLGSDAVSHAASVAHLSLMLGLRLEAYLIDQRKRLPAHQARDVVNLGVAGMLHDVGKCGFPDEAQNYDETDPPASTELLAQWQTHCQLGYEMVRDAVEPTAAAAVLHHHQHFDGSGFPAIRGDEGGAARRPAREGIHIFARIIQAANLYDRLATSLSNRRRSNVEVLHLIRTRHAGWIDPVILRTLQSVAPPFPPGSILSLTDGTAAVVVRIDQADPYFPIVRRLVGAEMRLDPESIDLREHGAPCIGRVGTTQVGAFLPRQSLSACA